jgi:hypothetical protein
MPRWYATQRTSFVDLSENPPLPTSPPLDKCSGHGVERAHDLADGVGGDAGVERRGVELGVAEQHLDHPNIDVLLQEMGGKGQLTVQGFTL